MPTSFRKSSQPTPARYRTPSPPRDAFEPFSPTYTRDTCLGWSSFHGADNVEARNGVKRPCLARHEETHGMGKHEYAFRGPMDAFASIALATTSGTQGPSDEPTSLQYTDEYDGRPSKRAKSEKLQSPGWSRRRREADVRPATSYDQPPDDRRREAELLLNFAQANYAQAAARLNSSSPTSRTNISKPSQATLTSTKESSAEAQVYEPEGFSLGHCHSGFQGVHADGKGSDLPGFSQAREILDDGFAVREMSAEQYQAMIDPPVTMEMATGIQDVDERHRDDHTPTLLEISEFDDVDLLPEPSCPEQDSSGDRGQNSQNNGKHEEHHVPKPSSSPVSLQENPEDSHRSDGKNQVSAEYESSIADGLQREGNTVHNGAEDTAFDGQRVSGTRTDATDCLVKEDAKANVIRSNMNGNDPTTNQDSEMQIDTSKPPAPVLEAEVADRRDTSTSDLHGHHTVAAAVCAACKFSRNSKGIETETDSTSWIGCDACKSWFHFACAGFKSEREVRSVDKFRCRKCKPTHGSTTYVRKSSRAHSAIDYAGLHQGVIKTSDERPEHHYIKPIKEGTISFLPETFARMRPELVTAEFFEKGGGMKEPIVIPASFSPSPKGSILSNAGIFGRDEDTLPIDPPKDDNEPAEDWCSPRSDREIVSDYGQDALDMVVPQGLTVRQVAELYGPEEKVEVIDVKSQNGETKKWNMRRWADYYENPNNKVVRNVISLEVSQSKLGRLIKRPQIVRDLDLQDSVWPEELLAKGEYPRVQFYCLMSVADCFTDFHIDFGGSSVFYHILKGKKTFLFIPPKEKHLKKYEEWCMSPAQNWTFLGDQTKECYRVDLSEGDTMLIPSGWIHAVWTPEDSLVIGGNFLTRLNFGMQLRVAQVEKATGVARKFRYPHFQKLHWYTALQYLETDPLPHSVRDLLHAGGNFHRDTLTHHNFDAWGENSRDGMDNYQARYYSQAELDGLPELTRYLLRTALIDIGGITDGISADTRNAVKKSIPRGYGEPMRIMKTFAAWCAWKRGNEPLPHWAYPDAVPEDLSPDKLSVTAMKKLDREAALSAPRRQSARMLSQQELAWKASSQSQRPSDLSNVSTLGDTVQLPGDIHATGQMDAVPPGTPARPRTTSGMSYGSHRKTACESCRKRRRACKHKGEVAASMATLVSSKATVESTSIQLPELASSGATSDVKLDLLPVQSDLGAVNAGSSERSNIPLSEKSEQSFVPYSKIHDPLPPNHSEPTHFVELGRGLVSQLTTVDQHLSAVTLNSPNPTTGLALPPRPRHKACNDCRKSKRRCIHDAFGMEDPVKVREQAIPRPHARKSHTQSKDPSSKKPSVPKQRPPLQSDPRHLIATTRPIATEYGLTRIALVANMVAQPSSSGGKTTMSPGSLDVEKQRDIAERASLLLDPALLACRSAEALSDHPTSSHDSPLIPSSIPTNVETQSNHQHLADACDSASNAEPEPVSLESKDSFDHPASSLVSPPASPHDELEDGSMGSNPQWAPSRSSSVQSSSELKDLQQRYTPESGSVRRASNSTCHEANSEQVPYLGYTEPSPTSKTRSVSRSEFMADEDSLKLIKQLQAQELGLRRRGKL